MASPELSRRVEKDGLSVTYWAGLASDIAGALRPSSTTPKEVTQ